MRLLGLEITRAKALSPVGTNRGWRTIIHEPETGAWQKNIEVKAETALAYSAVYACVTLIASDIGKMSLNLMRRDSAGVWIADETSTAYPVLRKPNRYQNRLDFFENWIVSKLIHGNTFVLKGRGGSGAVETMYVLDPCRTRVLVAPDGSVFYEMQRDNLTGQTEETVVIPQSEIIHDKMMPLFHPLVGVSPISSCGLPALHGLNIQRNSTTFFANGARPSGILTTATSIKEEEGKRYQEMWNRTYGAGGQGGTAVLGGDWKYVPITMNAVDSQLIEQLKWTAESVCSCFKVPPHMIGVGPPPTYNNIEALNQQYYSQCLQNPIEHLEKGLDEGLGLPDNVKTEFDRDDLIRMDTPARVKAAADAIGAGAMAPDEARKKYFGLGRVTGGSTPYLQQQNYSLAALDRRDSAEAEDAKDVQSEALNGAQITALQGLVVETTLGNLPKEALRAILAAAFPGLSEEEISAIVEPLSVEPGQPSAPSTSSVTVDEADEADGSDDEQRAIASEIYYWADQIDEREVA